MNIRGAIAGFVLGVIVTVPAALLAIHSGDEFARLIYPYSMLLLALLNQLAHSVTVPILMALVAFAQFPVYGAIIGASDGGTFARRWIVVGALLFMHLITAVVCFYGDILYFF